MRKYINILLTVTLIMCLTACGMNNKHKEKEYDITNNTENTDDKEVIEDEVTDSNSNELADKPKDEVLISETVEDAVEQSVDLNKDIQISDDWTNFEFAIDGVKIILPCTFEDLKNCGWILDRTRYNEDDLVFEAGTISLGGIKLENENYPDVEFRVGIINNTTEDIDIEECLITKVVIDKNHGYKDADSYPDVTLSKGIKWNASKENVIEAFGETDDIYESDAKGGYKIYRYTCDDRHKLNVSVFENEMGFSEFELEINAYTYFK